MRCLIQLMAAVTFSLVMGCGGGSSKMADKPTDEQVKMNQEAQKAVEAEERGTPVKKAK